MPSKINNLFFRETNFTGKTYVWEVASKWNRVPLGLIKWHAPWRRYVFCPCDGTLYDITCLGEIVNFIQEK